MASQIIGYRVGTQLRRRGPGRTRRRANDIGACLVVVLTMAPLGCRKAKPTQSEIRQMMRQADACDIVQRYYQPGDGIKRSSYPIIERRVSDKATLEEIASAIEFRRGDCPDRRDPRKAGKRGHYISLTFLTNEQEYLTVIVLTSDSDRRAEVVPVIITDGQGKRLRSVLCDTCITDVVSPLLGWRRVGWGWLRPPEESEAGEEPQPSSKSTATRPSAASTTPTAR